MSYRISQMGPNFLLVDSPANHPPDSKATIEFQVDDSRHDWEVSLPDGMRAGQQRVALALPAGG